MSKLKIPLLLVLVANFDLIGQSQKTISGYVMDAESGENLIGATILDYRSEKGTITNEFGFFSLPLPYDSTTLLISYVGFESSTRSILNSDHDLIIIELTPKVLEEVVIYDSIVLNTNKLNGFSINPKKIQSVPVLLGESDVVKVLHMFPGIQGGTEGNTGTYVRGGGAGQNLFLLDGIPVYNISHLFGFFSMFNTDAINQVKIIKGGFPARYGGRLASVVDITMKDGNQNRLSGSGTVGPLSSKVSVEGPLINTKTTFVLTGRRTLFDFVSQPIIETFSEEQNTSYSFYDFSGKITHRFSKEDKLSLSFYQGGDHFLEKEKSDGTDDGFWLERLKLRWKNQLVALRWTHVWTPKLFSSFTTSLTGYNLDVSTKSNYFGIGIKNPLVSQKEIYRSGIGDLTTTINFDFQPNSPHSVNFGFEQIIHRFQPGIYRFISDGSLRSSTLSDVLNTYENSAYLEDRWAVNNKLNIQVGVRGIHYVSNTYSFISSQPRISINYLMNNRMSFQTAYDRMNQVTHLLSSNRVGLPSDLWVPSTQNVKGQKSDQFSIGLSYNISDISIFIDAYKKYSNNVIQYEPGYSLYSIDNNWENKVIQGDGKSRGIELLIRKESNKISAWAGYTLSKTTRRFEEINLGEEFPFKFDRRHVFNIVSIYSISKNWAFSANWTYSSGFYLTLPSSRYLGNNLYYEGLDSSHFQGSNEILKFDEVNNFKASDNHRLDLAFEWKIISRRGFKSTTAFGAYNAYNRKNPFEIRLKESYIGAPKELRQYSLFPILPYIQWTINI